jgi:hypothetical protein
VYVERERERRGDRASKRDVTEGSEKWTVQTEGGRTLLVVGFVACRERWKDREREREQLLLEMNICVSLKELIKER